MKGTSRARAQGCSESVSKPDASSGRVSSRPKEGELSIQTVHADRQARKKLLRASENQSLHAVRCKDLNSITRMLQNLQKTIPA
jgi:hypothetical protein